MTRVLQLIIVVLAFLPVPGALAQQPDPGGEDFTGEQAKLPPMPTRAAQPGRGSNEITLEVKSFGIAGAARPGEWIGVWVAVNDSAEKVRNVMVRITVPDPDGDTALMQRVIVTNPGAVQRVWLYLRLPFLASMGSEFDITANEAIESGTPAAGEAQQYSPGRLLGRTRFQVGGRSVLPPYVGMLPVVGQYASGLEQYKWVADTNGNFSITGHELTEPLPGLGLQSIPDRWQGYSGATALVWTSAATEDNPLNLRKDQADAIREWVRRGGHFIVVLPNVGQNWVGQPGNLLADILPAAKVTRTENADLSAYRALITSDRGVSLLKDAVVQSFTPAIGSGWPADTYPIMVGPDNEVVVLRRIVGAGMVTVVGLDLASPKLHRITHGFMADQFWNRVLGKRMRTLTQAEVDNGNKWKPPPNSPDGTDVDSYAYNTHSRELDSDIARFVNDEGKAAVGLMMAFFVFVAYWLIAGPIGYFLLKQRNWKQHAWVGFLAAIGVFTAVAWAGANLLKPLRVYGKHLTILDGVYGQNTQRARSWVGVFLPSYGTQQVSVAPLATEPGTALGGEWHNLIATLDIPTQTGATGWSNFPDARSYVVDSRKPDTASFPSRATTKQVQVDWAGSLPEGWGMPRPVADASVPVGQEIRLVDRAEKVGRSWAIEGAVTHALPAAMTNVWITVVREPPRRESATPGERIRMDYSMVKLAGDWKPGDPIKLDALFDSKTNAVNNRLERFNDLIPSGALAGRINDQAGAADFGFNASFMDMLIPPPALHGTNNKGDTRYVFRRMTTHGFDISRWFTQPCVIIVGEIGTDSIDDNECPVPIRVSGEEVRKRLKGRTIVRWVYPLPAAPFRAIPPAAPATDETPASGDAPPEGSGGAKEP